MWLVGSFVLGLYNLWEQEGCHCHICVILYYLHIAHLSKSNKWDLSCGCSIGYIASVLFTRVATSLPVRMPFNHLVSIAIHR